MKLVTAYVNTVRIHWLAESLEAIGIREMRVTEYFSPTSKISKLQLLCAEDLVDDVTRTVHTNGTAGEPVDHLVHVEEFEFDTSRTIPPGSWTSILDVVHTRVSSVSRAGEGASHDG